MTGQAHWLTLAVLLGGGLFIYLLGAFARRLGGLRHVHRAVLCPALGTTTEVVALQSERTSRHLGIATCSALSGPVTCNRGCLEQLNPASR